MKAVLNIGEFKFGKDTVDYKYYKKEVMNIFYNNVSELFKKMEKDNLITKCSCKANIRHGYKDCKDCHGAGWIMKTE